MSRVRSELTRKGVHIAMGGAALALRWLTPAQAAACALVALLFNLFVLHRLTRRSLLREGERQRGFSWGIALYPAVVLALVLVFRHRMELAAAGWALLAFGDGMATVAGVLLGGPRLPWNRDKSWAGLLAFVLYGTATAAFLIRWTQGAVIDAARAGSRPVSHIGDSFLAVGSLGGVSADFGLLLAGCFLAATVAAWVESLDTGIDDNVLVPLVGGVALWAATLVRPLQLADAWPVLGPQFVQGAGVNLALALVAYATRGVSRSGALWGWVLGSALYGLAGWRGFLMLVAFFVLGTVSTKLGYSHKAALGIAQEKGGRRGARNAFANVGAGVVFALLAAVTAFPATCTLAMVAAFATAANDTVSSEIGQAYGRRHFLITSFRRVSPGTDGAVSLEGTLAGLVAGGLVALLAWSIDLVGAAGAGVITLAAFVGGTVESYLGATLERMKRIDNELVNFANTLIGALTAILLARLLF